MRIRTCLLLALATALLGAGLRHLVPVTPVDEEYRAVVRAYDPANRP